MSANKTEPPQIGDIWYRVDGQWIDNGYETYQGVELVWQEWRAVKLTRSGAWFQCVGESWRKQRFALASGARWLSRTKDGALKSLIARKRRHIDIVENQAVVARDTLELARAALAAAQAKEGQT